MSFNYEFEPRSDVLCVDLKSFYASCECVERGLDPLKAILVVMSNADNAGGLILAASPQAKKAFGISNVSRKHEIPNHPDLIIAPPQMNLYIEKNLLINDIYRRYVSNDDLHIYSIDESFLDIKASLSLFGTDAYGIAKMIQHDIKEELGLFCTIGIGDNLLLSKLALDNGAKHQTDMIADWRYEDVSKTIWQIPELTDMWGISTKTALRLNKMGISTIYELAHYDYYRLKDSLGVIGAQLYAHSWGIDRSNIREPYQALEKSYGNSQVLMKDYTNQREIEVVLREIGEQVATRIRRHHCQTSCIQLSVGFSRNEEDRGFSRQQKIPLTDNTKQLTEHLLRLFRANYRGQPVRNLSVSYSKLVFNDNLQLDLFSSPEEQISNHQLDHMVDTIRNKFGFKSLVHASSTLEGATALKRSSLVGGHAGGNTGLENNEQ